MRIDAHISLWKEAPASARLHRHFPGDDRTFLPEHIEPILARNRFDGGLLIATGSETGEIEQLARWCRESALLHGMVLAWGDGAMPSQTPETLFAMGATSLLRGYWVEDNSRVLREAARHCGMRGLALDVRPSAHPLAAEALLETAREFPELQMVLVHAGLPPLEHKALEGWMASVTRLAGHANVHCKLSGLWSSGLGEWNIATLQSLVSFLIEQFGERRLLFASDWPFCLPAKSWKECLARFTQSIGPRPMDFREALLGDNAARIYRLSTALEPDVSPDVSSSGSSLP
ncbi:MAG: amidohydrolase family protein [Bryobacterales bacterium]|nr:amidohydrolase family protein [Bryobacterales bacterium]